MNIFNFLHINFSKFILYRKPSIWTLSMAASKFEDRLDTSHCNIESYFSKGNTSINTSATSTNSVCHDTDQSLDSKSKFVKSAKPDIVSYFKKNQDAKIKPFKETEIDNVINDDNKELDSFLSVCNEVDSCADESWDSNNGKTCTENLLCDKQNESARHFEDKEQSACNDADFVDINDKSCNSKTESEIVLHDKQDKPLGFFTRKLNEQCKSYFGVGSEPSCDSSNETFSDTETGEASQANGVKTVASNNKNETQGFFTKTVTEQSNLNFDVGFEVNSDSSDSKFKLNDNETSEASFTFDIKTVALNNKNEPLGFFAKTVKEQSNLNTKFEINLLNSDSKLNDSEPAFRSDTETAASNNNNKPLGFFAKKLKERSESNFSVVSETSCDSLKNEPMKNNQAEHLENCNLNASSSVLMHQQSSCSVSNGDSECINLDPELTKLCEQCNKRIPIWEETEHLDYHLALNLSKEFSNNHRTVLHSSGNNSTSATGKNASQKSKSGRKRGSATKSTSQSKKSHVKTKTIDSFFKS